MNFSLFVWNCFCEKYKQRGRYVCEISDFEISPFLFFSPEI